MNLAIIGCGYVAEFYGKTLGNYPRLKLVGAYDSNPANLQSFCRRWSCRAYASLKEVITDSSVEMVLNLTNPRSHFDVTSLCLVAGKHVFSEKPLAMNSAQARELVELAEGRKLYLGAAPCSLLSETAQTVWKAIKDGAIGKVRLVYGNFDDGMIAPKMAPWNWRNQSGVPWPAKDEFEVGCTYEHAGYVLTWLGAFFGPATHVTSFASCQIPDKGIPVETMAPDFTVGCIEYGDSVVARVTCSLVAPKDKSLTIIGDDGIISVADVRNDLCPVYVRQTPPSARTAGIERRVNWLRRAFHLGDADREWHWQRKHPFARPATVRLAGDGKRVDFCRGPAEMVEAIQEQRPSRLSAQFAWHICELVEALQYPDPVGGRRKLTSSFDPIEPLAWLK